MKKAKLWTVWDNTIETFSYETRLLDEYDIPITTTKLCGVFDKKKSAKKLVDKIFKKKNIKEFTVIDEPDTYGYEYVDGAITYRIVAGKQSLVTVM